MSTENNGGAAMDDGRTKVDRSSDREIVVTRSFDAPTHIVFQAWTRADLFKRWWAPKSMNMTLLDCEMDVRTGGTYMLEFGLPDSQTFKFFGKYLEVVPDEKIVWTNEEGPQGAVTTVTFEARGDTTLVTYRDLYPSKEALEAEQGAEGALPEQFAQLDVVLAELAADN